MTAKAAGLNGSGFGGSTFLEAIILLDQVASVGFTNRCLLSLDHIRES